MWTIFIIAGYFIIAVFVLDTLPWLYGLKRDLKQGLTAALLYFFIPTNWDNSKTARYFRQTTFYLHFVLTVPMLLFVCFIDPDMVKHSRSHKDKEMDTLFSCLLPQFLVKVTQGHLLVLKIPKHSLHAQFDEFLSDIFEVKDN